MTTLHIYLPQDRLHALACGGTLPDRTSGSALFADISGSTALTEGMRQALGLRRGANEVYAWAAAVGNRERAHTVLTNLGVAAAVRKDYPAARDYTLQSLALVRETCSQRKIAFQLINLGEFETKLGNLPAARVNLRDGLAVSFRLGMLPMMVSAVTNFGKLAYENEEVT